MLKTTLKITALSAVSLTLLSACGAASKAADLAGNAANDLNRLAGGNGNNPTPHVADRVTSRQALNVPSDNGTPDNTADDTVQSTHSATQDTFSVRTDGADALIMTVDGVDYPLQPPARSGTGGFYTSPSSENTYFNLGNLGSANDSPANELYQIIAGTHDTIQGAYARYVAQTDIPNSESYHTQTGFATIGTQTTDTVVTNQTATATYTGGMWIEAYTTGIVDTDYGGDRSLPVTFNVNFDTNMISGEAAQGDLQFGESVITFAPAPIVGNGFAGTFTMNQVTREGLALNNNPTGGYAGNFFGPAADDLAGVLEFFGTSEVGALFGQGGFRADRQDPAQ